MNTVLGKSGNERMIISVQNAAKKVCLRCCSGPQKRGNHLGMQGKRHLELGRQRKNVRLGGIRKETAKDPKETSGGGQGIGVTEKSGGGRSKKKTIAGGTAGVGGL